METQVRQWLRVLAVIAFLVAAALVWLVDNTVDDALGTIAIGLALLAAADVVPRPERPPREPRPPRTPA